MKEAHLYEKLENYSVRCNLCAHHCVISEGKLGVCCVRKNVGGDLFTLVYGRCISSGVDPVEKKPLYHFYPGTGAYSIATPGCNFRCRWCQNADIAHMPREQERIIGSQIPPRDIVSAARCSGSRSIAYTYTEPTIFYEYAYDIAQRAHEFGIANIFVTNGYMTIQMLEELHPYLDAANVDLKAFREKTYHRLVGAGLAPILESMKRMKEQGVWLEVTTLVIPGINDDPAEIKDSASFIANELGLDVPWHISRFYPSYRMTDRPPTPVCTLEKAREIGIGQGLRYIYLGNVQGDSNTNCYNCGKLLIQRTGYWVEQNNIRNGECPQCGTIIAGIWSDQDNIH